MINLMITVTDRSFTKKFASFYSEQGLNVSTVTAGMRLMEFTEDEEEA